MVRREERSNARASVLKGMREIEERRRGRIGVSIEEQRGVVPEEAMVAGFGYGGSVSDVRCAFCGDDDDDGGGCGSYHFGEETKMKKEKFYSFLPLVMAVFLLAFSLVAHPVVAVNTYSKLYAKGGRSFSVIRCDTMEVVWDSGDAFERNISSLSPSYFNSRGFTTLEYETFVRRRIENQTAYSLVKAELLDEFRAGTLDSMSDKMGCQPRALVSGLLDGRKSRYLFVALKNPSGIMVYNFTDPIEPVFRAWFKLPLGDLEPEALHFTEADESSSSSFLYVSCGFSATLLVYEVSADGELALAKRFDGTVGESGVPFGATLINGLPSYSSLAYIPASDSIYRVPVLLVANQYARRMDVFLINTTVPGMAVDLQPLGAVDFSPGMAEPGGSPLFKPGFPSSLYVQGNVLAITVVPYDPSDASHSVEVQAAQSDGVILFYQINEVGQQPFRFLGVSNTGSWPKKTVFAGSRFLVANYAKWAPLNGGPQHVDPPGGVTEITLPPGVYSLTGALQEMSEAVQGKDLSSFSIDLSFDRVILDQEIELPGTGMIATDPQPIDIAYSNNSDIAYVLLRSSNAIAKLNVTEKRFVSVHWLGAKNYSSVGIDPSSKDGVARPRSFDNLFGLYMPSSMKVIPAYPNYGEQEYLVIVNEGDDTQIPDGDVTVKELDLDATAFPNAEEVQSPAQLGDLRVVRWKGLTSQVHTQLYDNLTRTAETLCDTYSYFQFQVNASQVCMDMRVQLAAMQGTPDVYVSKGAAVNPSIYDLTWSNYESTSDNVENFVISHLDPEFQPGTYYLGVYAYCEEAKNEAAIYNITVSLEYPKGLVDSANDLLTYPVVNVPLPVAFHHYSFCVNYPCAPIVVNLSDCKPEDSFCPELVVSPTVKLPEPEDYTWKTMGGRRAVTIPAEDPYNSGGVFYVGVLSRCVSPDPAKCATPSESVYSLTVSYDATPLTECPLKPQLVLSAPVGTITLEENVPVNQSTNCGQYSYYSVKVEDPCNDLVLEATPMCPTCGLPRLYVSKDFIAAPKQTDRTWTSSESQGKSTITVSAFDRDFSVGTYFVGVHADCASSSAPAGGLPIIAATYSIRAQFSSDHVYRWQNVTPVDMMNKVIANQYVGTPDSYDYYHFCIRNQSAGDVVVKLVNCVSPADCPNTYWWPEMLVSKSNWVPTVNDRAWRLAQLNRNNVTLKMRTPDVRPGGGHYFVGVYAWCNKECNVSQSEAGENCAPCANILNSPYNLSVQQGGMPMEIVQPIPEISPLSANSSLAGKFALKSAASARFSPSHFGDWRWGGVVCRILLSAGIAFLFGVNWLQEAP